jgi:hypothetical protein
MVMLGHAGLSLYKPPSLTGLTGMVRDANGGAAAEASERTHSWILIPGP